MRLLLIDDDGLCAEAFRRLAAAAGVHCVHASTLAEARMTIAQARFDAWVVDELLGADSGRTFLGDKLVARPRAALWTPCYVGPCYYDAGIDAVVIAKTDVATLRRWLDDLSLS